MFEGTKNLADTQEKRRLFSKINRFYLFYSIFSAHQLIVTCLSMPSLRSDNEVVTVEADMRKKDIRILKLKNHTEVRFF